MNEHLPSLLALGGFVVLAVLLFLRSGAKKKNLAQKLSQGALILDVRTAGEFQAAHYPGARNVPLQNLKSKADKLAPKDKPIVIYCASGARAGSAAGILRSAGYKDVTNAGGLSAMPRMEVEP